LQDANDLPESFNAAEKWTYCKDSILTVRDQSACGSCWATSSAGGMSDMHCLKNKGKYSPYISEVDILSCCSDLFGRSCGNCVSGGHVPDAFQWWIDEGVVTGGLYNSAKGCMPYPIPPKAILNGSEPPPMPTCDGYCHPSTYLLPYNKDKNKGNSYDIAVGVDEMKSAIYNYGPIVILYFKVYADFHKYYTGGIYHYNFGGFDGGHSVKVIGWGSEDGVPYWLAVNSWGAGWAENGFFKMIMGTNECGFEDGAVFGAAVLSDIPTTTSTSTTTTTPTTTTTKATSASTTRGKSIAPFVSVILLGLLLL